MRAGSNKDVKIGGGKNFLGKNLGGPKVEALPPTREKDDALLAAGVVGMLGEGLTNQLAWRSG